jgi:hypothetical protein
MRTRSVIDARWIPCPASAHCFSRGRATVRPVVLVVLAPATLPFVPRGLHARETKGGYAHRHVRARIPAPHPRVALLHIVVEDRRACSHVPLPRTPFVTAGPNIREAEGRENEEHIELCCACVSSAMSSSTRPSAGIKAPIDDPSWTRTTIFDLGSSVCRLFPCQYCGLMIRPRFRRGFLPIRVDGRWHM